jgi:hypothetical protein
MKQPNIMKRFTATGFLLVFLFFSLFSLNSCKKEETKSEPEPEPVPTPVVTDTCGTPLMTFLKNGNQLVYDFTISGSTVPLTHKIKTYGSKGEFKTVISSSLYTDSVYSKECKGWMQRSPRYPLLSSYKSRKSVTAVNDTWTYSDGAITATYIVLAKNISVTVGAGTFVCDKINYKQNGSANTDTIYFSNEVGDVKYIGTGFDYKLKSKNF